MRITCRFPHTPVSSSSTTLCPALKCIPMLWHLAEARGRTRAWDVTPRTRTPSSLDSFRYFFLLPPKKCDFLSYRQIDLSKSAGYFLIADFWVPKIYRNAIQHGEKWLAQFTLHRQFTLVLLASPSQTPKEFIVAPRLDAAGCDVLYVSRGIGQSTTKNCFWYIRHSHRNPRKQLRVFLKSLLSTVFSTHSITTHLRFEPIGETLWPNERSRLISQGLQVTCFSPHFQYGKGIKMQSSMGTNG